MHHAVLLLRSFQLLMAYAELISYRQGCPCKCGICCRVRTPSGCNGDGFVQQPAGSCPAGTSFIENEAGCIRAATSFGLSTAIALPNLVGVNASTAPNAIRAAASTLPHGR